jgi:hypothetical protein
LEETAYLDGKAQLPDPRANVELAVDICAMSVGGGLLLIGAGENDAKTRLVKPQLVELAGVRERISQIASTAIAEPVPVDVRALALPEDSERGFLAIVVPPSPRAPHQVISRDHGGKYHGRFYGREAAGNRILSEAEVAALYTRRERLTASDAGNDAKQLLAARSSVAFASGARRVFLALVIKPLLFSGGLFQRVEGSGATDMLNQLLHANEAAIADPVSQRFQPNLAALVGQWNREDADHYGARLTVHDKPELHMTVSDGSVVGLTSRRVGDDLHGRVMVFEQAVAGLVFSGLVFSGHIFAATNYYGPVDIGLYARPLSGIFSATRLHQTGSADPYPAEDYVRATRVTAAQLADRLEAQRLTRGLVQPLTDALVGSGFDPLA